MTKPSVYINLTDSENPEKLYKAFIGWATNKGYDVDQTLFTGDLEKDDVICPDFDCLVEASEHYGIATCQHTEELEPDSVEWDTFQRFQNLESYFSDRLEANPLDSMAQQMQNDLTFIRKELRL